MTQTDSPDEADQRSESGRMSRAAALSPLALLGGLGVLGLVRESVQKRQMFSPTAYPRGAWEPWRHGVEAEDHWFEAADGVRLHGWWIPHPNPRGTVLYCHGNSGSLGSEIDTLRRFRRLRCNLFAFDYRGYGRSEGAPKEAGLYRDVRGAYRFLVGELAVPESEVILFGHSLGGAVAVDAATECQVAGLVVQNSLTQMRDMAKVNFTDPVGSRLPIHWVARNQFRSIDKIGSVDCPVLIIHGRLDQRIPIEQGRRLFEAAAEPREFLEIPGAGHNDIARRGRLRYWLRLSQFRDRTLRAARLP